jgi:hypothetical protein
MYVHYVSKTEVRVPRSWRENEEEVLFFIILRLRSAWMSRVNDNCGRIEENFAEMYGVVVPQVWCQNFKGTKM